MANNSFTLTTPIPFINTTITDGYWYGFDLGADSCNTYWALQANGQDVVTGNWPIPEDVFQAWGNDNSIVTTALVAAAPWNQM